MRLPNSILKKMGAGCGGALLLAGCGPSAPAAGRPAPRPGAPPAAVNAKSILDLDSKACPGLLVRKPGPAAPTWGGRIDPCPGCGMG